eukprot:g42073.t1
MPQATTWQSTEDLRAYSACGYSQPLRIEASLSCRKDPIVRDLDHPGPTCSDYTHQNHMNDKGAVRRRREEAASKQGRTLQRISAERCRAQVSAVKCARSCTQQSDGISYSSCWTLSQSQGC